MRIAQSLQRWVGRKLAIVPEGRLNRGGCQSSLQDSMVFVLQCSHR